MPRVAQLGHLLATINEFAARRLGGLHCARLVLAQTDFEEVERYQRA